MLSQKQRNKRKVAAKLEHNIDKTIPSPAFGQGGIDKLAHSSIAILSFPKYLKLNEN